MTASLADARAADADHTRHEWGPFAPLPLPAHLPIAGRADLPVRRRTRSIVEPGGSRPSARTSPSAGRPRGASGRGCRFTSPAATGRKAIRCWPASSPTSARRPAPVAFGGRGEFDGVMTGPFRRPRVEGTVHRRGSARVGHALGRRQRAHRRRKQLRARCATASCGWTTRRFAPTACSRSATRAQDGGERDQRARSASTRRDLDSLRHAFEIDDYPVSGLLSGEFHLTGEYAAARSASAR